MPYQYVREALTADNLPANEAVSTEVVTGRDSLTLTPLDKLDESAGLWTLRQAVADLLPRADLPPLWPFGTVHWARELQ